MKETVIQKEYRKRKCVAARSYLAEEGYTSIDGRFVKDNSLITADTLPATRKMKYDTSLIISRIRRWIKRQ